MQLRDMFLSGNDTSLAGLLRGVVFTVTKEVLREPIPGIEGSKFRESIFSLEQVKIERPSNENYGDYSTNIALILAGRLGMKPIDVAQKLQDKLNDYIKTHQTITTSADSNTGRDTTVTPFDILENSDIAGPGFLNMTIRTEYIITQLLELLNREKTVRTIQTNTSPPSRQAGLLAGRKIFLEFAHPNTHKEFHIGHLRNIAVGESLVRILEANGAELFRANYEGDVGLHVGKAIWGTKLKIKNEKLKIEELRRLTPSEKVKFLGAGYALGSKAYEEDEKAKKEIIDLNKAIYTDPRKVELWEETRGWSLEYFDTVYKRVGTHFDRLFFESEVEKPGREMVKKAAKDGIFVKDPDGSIYFPGEKYGLNNCVFVTREDYATYEGKEIALEELEYETFPYDLSINNVASEQSNFFQIGYKATEVLFPRHKDKHFHLSYGMVQLKSGKMSSRTGQVITADWLIDQAKSKIYQIFEKSNKKMGSDLKGVKVEQIAEKVAVAAVKYSMLRVNPLMKIAFDLAASVSLAGDSGPYLMYTYARCRSVMRKSQGSGVRGQGSDLLKPETYNLKPNTEELSLLRTLYRFPEVVIEAGRTLSPNLLCSFLFDLAQKYNLFYNKHSILGVRDQVLGVSKNQNVIKEDMNTKTYNLKPNTSSSTTGFRLFLTHATSSIIKQGLYLLGIETVEKM